MMTPDNVDTLLKCITTLAIAGAFFFSALKYVRQYDLKQLTLRVDNILANLEAHTVRSGEHKELTEKAIVHLQAQIDAGIGEMKTTLAAAVQRAPMPGNAGRMFRP